MNKLQAEVSSCSIEWGGVLIYGGGMLHKLHLPTDGLVMGYIQKIIPKSDLFLIFDRYMPDSIKSGTRDARVGVFRRSHKLSLNR